MTNMSQEEWAMRIAETNEEIRACARVLRELRERLDEDEIARGALAVFLWHHYSIDALA